MNPYLAYFKDFAPRINELIENGYVTGATITFPVREPFAGKAALHFTGHGVLASVGDTFSSKLISTWDEPPVLYDISTNDTLGPLGFLDLEDYGHVEAFMKQCGMFDIQVTGMHLAETIKNHYAANFETIDVSIFTSPSGIHM